MAGSEPFQAFPCCPDLFFVGLGEQTVEVSESVCHDSFGCDVPFETPMQFRTDVADVFLDVPDAFSAASLPSEKGDVAGVALWIVGADKAQQGGLAGTVGTGQGPVFPFPDHPVQILEDGPFAVPDCHFVEADNLGGGSRIVCCSPGGGPVFRRRGVRVAVCVPGADGLSRTASHPFASGLL